MQLNEVNRSFPRGKLQGIMHKHHNFQGLFRAISNGFIRRLLYKDHITNHTQTHTHTHTHARTHTHISLIGLIKSL